MSKPIQLSFALLFSVVALATASAAEARQFSARAEAGPAAFLRARALDLGHVRATFGAFAWPFGSASALVGSAPVGNGPGALAVDPATHTAYVANGFNVNGPPAGGNTVSVIDTRRCDAQDVSRCRGPWPTITVGNLPSGIAIDEKTDTVYVTNFGDNTVSVFKGATCNGQYHFGCSQTPVAVPVGSSPVGIFADPANDTVYIPDLSDQDVSMLDSATCNATDLAACPHSPAPVVSVGAFPDDVDVNQSSHTVYVATYGSVSVFDANTCNATDQSSCGSIGTLPGDPDGVYAGQVDPANDTLYTANGDKTVSAFGLHDCNVADLSGCATDVPGTVTLPLFADQSVWLATDPSLHTVYVDFQGDDLLSVINTDLCNGSNPAGCAGLTPPEIHTGADPEMVGLDPQTQTLYTANAVDSDVSVIDPTRCDAQTTSGCRQRVPEIPVGGFTGIAADPAVNTIYIPSAVHTVSMVNASACNAFHAAGCSHTPPTVTVGARPFWEAVDQATHTVYIANESGSVSVLDDRTCNATVQTGCGALSTLKVPTGSPDDVEVDSATDTVYVAAIAGSGPNLIWVFNGASCNGSDRFGCSQKPTSVKFADSANGSSSAFIAVDAATNTVYATNVVLSSSPLAGGTVYVINGATCDAAHTGGCGQTPATVTLPAGPSNPFGVPGQEPNPFGIAVDQRTDTIYTANLADGEGPGTVSVINGTICNGEDMSGCGQTPATARAGFGTIAIAADQLTNQVYAVNGQDTSVTTINGYRCNGANAAGCGRTRTRAIVGDEPGPLTIDPVLDTAYVGDNEGVSVVPLNHCQHSWLGTSPRAQTRKPVTGWC